MPCKICDPAVNLEWKACEAGACSCVCHEEDKCPKCNHRRKYHFAVDDGDDRVDAWCEYEHHGCGCDEVFGGIPGRPGAIY